MKKKLISIFLTVFLCLSCASAVGCSDKPELTVYLNNTSLLQNYAPFLQSKVPEAKLVFIVGRDSENFYSFKNQNNDLPDIITLGTVSPNDEFGLRDSLMDLGETEAAASVSEVYLSSYRDANDALKWLPVGGELNGIIADKGLFEEHNIAIPTDYASFKSACEQFKALGIIPFASDYKYDYTCLHTLEGSAVSVLISNEGKLWRKNYEHNLTNELDETIWKAVFDKFSEFATDTGLTAEMTTRGYNNTRNAFLGLNGETKAAMIRGKSAEMSAYGAIDQIILPYFGETASDNRYITTPTFHVALNAKLNEKGNDKKKELALKVLDAMFSEDGYKATFANETQYFVSYSDNYKTAIPALLSNIEPYIQSNYLFPLVTSDNFLSSAMASVKALLNGEANPAEAFQAMNNALKHITNNTPETYPIDTAYSVAFTKGGSKATSAVANTFRKIAEADLLLAPSSICTGSIYQTEYTSELLDECIQASGNHLYVGEFTGAEIRALVKSAVEGYGSLNDPFSEQTLPVVSGMVMRVKETDGKFTLQDVTVNGSSLSDTATYKFAIADHSSVYPKLVSHALGADAHNRFEMTEAASVYAHSIWANYIKDGGKIEAPTDYIVIK